MKRSEMLDVIKSCMYHLGPEDPEALKLSEMILTRIEDFGMLPPAIESSYKKYGVNVYRENNYWEDLYEEK